ncbi:MAG: threonylcarbamoyl-AMP synthase [Fimbriimonadales bacterium]|nr:threonylcarbamoyl-AMP synthase [Fimbriimonadales bacterium]
MKTEVLEPTPENIRHAAEVLRAGGLVAFPTETVYGLGANALDDNAVRKIFQAKGRPETNPLIVHVSGYEMASRLGDVPKGITDKFWPGPLTLVVKRSRSVPDSVTAGGDTVGLRCPAHPVAMALLESAGVPIAAPSANRSTGVSPVTAQHVLEDLDGKVEIILDGGQCPKGIESTVLDLTSSPPSILRPGSVLASDIEGVLGETGIGQVAGVPKSPGQGHKHYAPRTRIHLSEGDGRKLVESLVETGHKVGWMPIGLHEMEGAETISMPADPTEYAAKLYVALRKLDKLGLDAVVIEKPPLEPAWTAVLDRLNRASSFD